MTYLILRDGSRVEIGRAPRDVEAFYAMRAGEAQLALAGDLPPGASISQLLAAFRNTNGIGGAS